MNETDKNNILADLEDKFYQGGGHEFNVNGVYIDYKSMNILSDYWLSKLDQALEEQKMEIRNDLSRLRTDQISLFGPDKLPYVLFGRDIQDKDVVVIYEAALKDFLNLPCLSPKPSKE